MTKLKKKPEQPKQLPHYKYAPQIGILYNKNASATGDNDEYVVDANKNSK